MRKSHLSLLILILIAISFLWKSELQAQSTNSLQTPAAFYGYEPGSDRNLFDYDVLISYLKKADAVSDKMKMIEIGKSPMGKTMYLAFVSSAENIANLEHLKHINKELALNPNLSESQRNEYFDEGKAFLLATLSMHSGEVGPAQAAPLIVYELLTTVDTQILNQLNDVMFMFVDRKSVV